MLIAEVVVVLVVVARSIMLIVTNLQFSDNNNIEEFWFV